MEEGLLKSHASLLNCELDTDTVRTTGAWRVANVHWSVNVMQIYPQTGIIIIDAQGLCMGKSSQLSRVDFVEFVTRLSKRVEHCPLLKSYLRIGK